VPTLVVGSDEDVVFPITLQHQLVAAIPGAQLAVIPDCGHCSFVERPHNVNQLIDQFVNEGNEQ
jgi:3-oxoadipate enol-lactonase